MYTKNSNWIAIFAQNNVSRIYNGSIKASGSVAIKQLWHLHLYPSATLKGFITLSTWFKLAIKYYFPVLDVWVLLVTNKKVPSDEKINKNKAA